MTLLSKLAIALTLLTPLAAQAHYPVMDCGREGAELVCKVGYSDGTFATGAEVVMYSYDDEVLATVKANGHSQARFTEPKGEFYIRFDAGHEDPAEFDYAELL
ncbi:MULTISPECIES: hypothetical protein [Aeromonas]|jgi:hypothetical protein|uniref:Uncharacterized protein n=1 Tax=Aeromonas sobria TaxID=646 RepID=A0A2N3J346_AERSO|nr:MULTISPECIES: hypothetical protein [Aeromonas]ATL91981.1 hypothetical protein CK911_03600 [Aeromonas sp. CU5]ELM3616328.1 hypothetical protein [Aeromonas sobria]PKQ76439.1 hypothetical protein AOX56_18720 [Aeromonas sobria]PKQ78035.1 hypothetical protein CJF47_07050 [Aeromonas sobria]PKQ80183.1 hypothetical protein CJP16_07550 [Aeromonas sobria]